MKKSLIGILLAGLLLPVAAQAPFPFGIVGASAGASSGGSGEVFTYYSANFDGVNDYITHTGDLTGLADGDKGLLSFWIKVDVNFTAMNLIWMNPSYLFIRRDAADNISVFGLNSSAATVLELTSNGGGGGWIQNDGLWHHVIASWDLSQSAKSWVYVDGVDRTARTTHTVGETINYASGGDWGIGARPDDGSGKFDGLLCEFYFTNEYLDLTVSSNRDKFYNSGTAKPVDLGSTGSLPTGTQPKLYFKTQPPAWENNSGSGGTFTEVGSITDGGSDKP